MATIALKGMRFYAFHGYYEFERRIGNNFVVDVDAQVEIKGDPNDNIDKTLNYEEIYKITDRYMQKKYLLLEGLAYDIGVEIKAFDSKVKSVKVVLTKLNPPVGGKVDKAQVTIEI
jgi:dihydroneopterin aldolase